MLINSYASSEIGKKSSSNEDNYILPEKNEVYNINPNVSVKGHLFLLCDGMGGANAGEVASKLCCGWLFKEFYESKDSLEDLPQWFAKEIDSLNNRLFQLSEKYPDYNGMGTTLVNLLIKDDMAYYNNVGDSRLYLFRANKLIQLTEDDSEVWKMFKSGLITKDEILTNSRKNIITRAIATGTYVEVHEYEKLKLEPGDQFIMCSDGLTDFVTDGEIELILNKGQNPEELIEALMLQAQKNKTNDDTTIIIIEIEE